MSENPSVALLLAIQQYQNDHPDDPRVIAYREAMAALEGAIRETGPTVRDLVATLTTNWCTW